jgi:hypothetical protein
MIKLKLKTIENVAILKLEEGTYEELNKINISGIRGLGGFTIKETLSYLMNTIEVGVVAYNFKTVNEAETFKDKLKEEVKALNGGIKGVFKLKEVLA